MSTKENKKIIFVGPVSSGKTTAVHTMSNIPIVTTNEHASGLDKGRKPPTTVAMDYGHMRIGEKEKIHLYGIPGNERFEFMWDLLKIGSAGIILLLDNSRENPQKDLKRYTAAFKDSIENGDLVIGVTKTDLLDAITIADYRKWLQELSISSPVFTIDPRQRKDVSSLVQALLYSLDPGMAA